MRPNALPRLHQAILAAIFSAVALHSGICLAAESDDIFHMVQPETKSQLWINPGMASYHFDQSKNYNSGNWGAGLEYRFNTVASVTAGRFYNSDRAYSNYAGIYYQPIAIGPIKIGAVFGGFNGYPATNNGGWFAAALPALSWEGEWVGANVFIIPTIGDRVHGAISLQLKLKVWE
ncbi:hypothetical protein AOC28_06830 [Polynucleobacter sp. MWH-Adler-W8]|nr:hypothetical protein AOC28_06830 [Polynucleobacter sp. MWH-Adler-W8]